MYNIQVVPVAIGLIIFYIPTWLRKISEIYYAPLYFTLAPLRFLNSHIDRYYFQDKNEPRYRTKIIKTAYLSVFIDAVLIPLSVGIILSFIFEEALLEQFNVSLIIFLSIRLIKSLVNFTRHKISSPKVSFILFLVYLLYLFIVIDFINMSYYWASVYVLKGEYLGLLIAIKDILLRKIFLPVITLGILVNIFSAFLTKSFDELENKTYDSDNL